jgi:predicted RNA-binding Zn-ribbon protein involved in translation (DUF1610 family)
VTPRICSRCHTVLHREDEGTLVYCWNCGAPQVQLSEELREQIDQQISAQHAAANPSTNPAPLPTAPTNAIVWRGAIQIAGLAGAIAAALTLLAFALPPISLLSFFWFISAPIIVLGIYSSRHRLTRITTGFGARLGLLTGLAILAASTTLDTIGLVFERFVFHSTADIDKQIATLFTQMHATITAQPGPASKAALDMLAIPEFRAGILLASITLCLGIYLAFSATAGAFAGYLRSRTPRT